MTGLTFIVNGVEVDSNFLRGKGHVERAKAPVKPKEGCRREMAHKGWRVMGHPPGSLEAAQESNERELARWASMSEDRRTEARGRGEKEPKPWDEASWRRNSRLHAVRSKPYMVPEAASECAEMARKAGWIDVSIVELKKGEA